MDLLAAIPTDHGLWIQSFPSSTVVANKSQIVRSRLLLTHSVEKDTLSKCIWATAYKNVSAGIWTHVTEFLTWPKMENYTILSELLRHELSGFGLRAVNVESWQRGSVFFFKLKPINVQRRYCCKNWKVKLPCRSQIT